MQENMPTSENKILTQEEMLQFVLEVFEKRLPFNQFLGFNIIRQGFDKAVIKLPWQDQLMGNPFHKILHGGVTAATLDTVGGLMAMLYAVKDLDNMPLQDFLQRISTIGTIDMRVDYLRPGKGKEFTAEAKVIRKGNKVAVCRMELHNDEGTHIAFGTATYIM